MLRAEHVKEMNRANDKLNEMRETENRRALNAYYKARYRARLYSKDTIFKSSTELIIKCIWVLIESLSTSKKLKLKTQGEQWKLVLITIITGKMLGPRMSTPMTGERTNTLSPQ